MTLIKAQEAGTLIRDAIVLDLGDLSRQADAIIARAHDRAAEIEREAQTRAQALVESADGRGYEQGLARGEAEGRQTGTAAGTQSAIESFGAQLEGLTTSWTVALEDWQQRRDEMLAEAHEHLITLAIAISEKIIYRIVEVDPTVIEDQLASALALVSRVSAVSITISPEDRDLAERALPSLLERISAGEHVRLTDDPALTRGGCRVCTGRGTIDATVEKQLDRIVETLLPPERLAEDDEDGSAPGQAGPEQATPGQAGPESAGPEPAGPEPAGDETT